MALARAFCCALPLQTFEKHSSVIPLKQNSGPCFVSISPTSTIRVRRCVSSQTPDFHSGSSLADFNVITADVVKLDMQSEGKPRLTFYKALVERLAADGHLLEMADLIAILVDAGIDRYAFLSAVKMDDVQSASRAALGGGHLDVFVAFVHRLRSAGFTPLNFVGGGVLTLLSQQCQTMLIQGEVDECFRLLTTLSECGFSAKRFLDVRTVITTCARIRNVDLALRYAGLLPLVNRHYNFIMQEFGRLGDMESVFTAFRSMVEAGIKPDMYSYRSLMDACAHRGDVDKAISVFQEILSSGSIPNVYVYNSFMNVRAQETDVVWQLYTDMQLLGVKPDLATYNIMLKSCSLSKSFEKAFSLYQHMESIAVCSGLKLDVFTYTTTIHIFGDAKMWELALKVKEDMVASGVVPNVMTWTALIGACANVGMVDKAFSLFHEMWIAGCAANEQTYNMLINACCLGSQHERAFQLFNEWKENGQISPYRQSKRRESFSNCGASPGQSSKLYPGHRMSVSGDVMETFSARILHSKPNLVTYNMLMKSCAEEPVLVKEIMEDIVSAGLAPNLLSWSTCIDAYGSKGNVQEVVNLLKDMKQEGITPDLILYTSIIKACVKAGDPDKAFEYFRQLKEDGLRPNKVTYHTLFKAQRTCRKFSEVQRALALYEEMREAGYAPNDGILRVLLAQWAEGVIEGDEDQKTARFSLQFQNEVSVGYSKMLLQNVAVHAQEPEAEPNLVIDLHGLSRGEARVAVLAVLRIIKERHKQGYRVKDDLVIITGVGRHSEVPGLPIVRQAILHVLEKELCLPVKFGSAKVHITRKISPRMSSEDLVPASGLETEYLVVDTTYSCNESQSPDTSSMHASRLDTGTYGNGGNRFTDAFVIRKPTNSGRLIVAKDALEGWLSKRRSISVARNLVELSEG